MKKHNFTGQVKELIERASSGQVKDIDFIMEKLSSNSSLAMTRFVDYALSWVENPHGIAQIKFYLFNGTMIQRNYASLYFNRRGDWIYVKEAFDKGLIDEIQAYAR